MQSTRFQSVRYAGTAYVDRCTTTKGRLRFSSAALISASLAAELALVLRVLPAQLIQRDSFSSTQAGVALLPFALAFIVLAGETRRTCRVLGARWLLAFGAPLAALGYAMIALQAPTQTYWSGSLPGLVLAGIGMRLRFHSGISDAFRRLESREPLVVAALSGATVTLTIDLAMRASLPCAMLTCTVIAGLSLLAAMPPLRDDDPTDGARRAP